MFERFSERMSTGWELAKQSFQVLKLDKELMVFPICSMIALLVVMATFAVPLFVAGVFTAPSGDSQSGTGLQILMYAVFFLFYFVSYFVIFFFNSALVGCAIIRLKGGDPVVSDGFGAAMARLPQIAAWSLVAASVGMILKLIESRSQQLGALIANLIGMAWSITTFFVVPVLVVEKAGPIHAIKRSASMIKQTWGESLTANFGIGIITFLCCLLGFLPVVGGIMLLGTSVLAGVLLIGLGVIWILLVSLVSSALQTIVLAALYIYAAEGTMPAQFDSNAIQHAFAKK